MEFNIQLFDEEVEGSASEAEVDEGAKVFLGAPDCAPLPGDSRVPLGASPSASPAGAPPFDSSTSASRGPTSGIRLSFFFFFFWCILARSLGFCIASNFDYLLIYQDSSINFFAPFPISSI